MRYIHEETFAILFNGKKLSRDGKEHRYTFFLTTRCYLLTYHHHRRDKLSHVMEWNRENIDLALIKMWKEI